MTISLTGDLTTDMVYAIYGSILEFGPENGEAQVTPSIVKPKYEGRAVFELLKGSGVRIYLIARDIGKLGEEKIYHSLLDIPESVDVLINCLRKDQAVRVVKEASKARIQHIFFQPRTDSSEALKICKANNINIIKGCMLVHWQVRGLTRFLSPCFYRGLRSTKLQVN